VNDLTAKEQRAVRTALRFLRLHVGAWGPLAKALRYEWDSIQKVATGKRSVTPALALRVARFAGVAVDELLTGSGCRPASARIAAVRRTTSPTRRPWSSNAAVALVAAWICSSPTLGSSNRSPRGQMNRLLLGGLT
jgi:hypothetical protein